MNESARVRAIDQAVRKRPKDRRDRILGAAERLFSERGYHLVSIEQIAAVVGVTGAAVYRHFPDKEALLVSVVERSVDRLHQAFLKCETATRGDMMSDLVRTLARVTYESRQIVDVYARESRHIAPERRRTLDQLQRDNKRIWTTALRELRPDLRSDHAQFIYEAVAGIARSVTRYPPRLPSSRVIDVLASAGVAAITAALEMSDAAPTTVSSKGRTEPEYRTMMEVPRRGSRREMLLSAAVQLIWRRGYNGVGIDDIADAAGIQGPTAYSYFSSKEEILWTAFNRVSEQLASGVGRAFTERSTAVVVERLIESYIDIVVNEPELMAVYMSEDAALSADHLTALRRAQKSYLEDWTFILRELRPELSEHEARTLVRAALSVGDGYVQEPTILSVAESAQFLRAMVRHTLFT